MKCFGDLELSRRHAEFFLKDEVLEIKDLASANGVYVNHQKVGMAVLQPGDQVRMGSVTLLVIGPKVEVAQADDEDATLFMPALNVPKPTVVRPSVQAATVNPLKVATANAASMAQQEAVAQTRPVNKVLIAVLAFALAIGAALAIKTLL